MEESRIQTAMTIAGVAFAIATFAPATGGEVDLGGKPLVRLLLLEASMLLTACSVISVVKWYNRERTSGEGLATLGALEAGSFLLMLALVVRFYEFMR